MLVGEKPMKTIANFDSPEDAYLFLAFLGSREIAAAVLDEYVSQLFWHYRAATGGVRVVIHDEADWEAAEAARSEYFAAINAAPAVVSEVRCWPLVLLISWVVGVPLFLWGKARVGGRQAAVPVANRQTRNPTGPKADR
jgi:hypothetical protein